MPYVQPKYQLQKERGGGGFVSHLEEVLAARVIVPASTKLRLKLHQIRIDIVSPISCHTSFFSYSESNQIG
jgi:hypothetical protein